MADGDHVSCIDGDRLWDADAREWRTTHSHWAAVEQAAAFAGRDGLSGFLDGPGRPVRWSTAVQTRQWWRQARPHFEVPGRVSAPPDPQGRTWTAHIWRRDSARLIVFEANC